jgi:hypothetical protein
VANAMSINNGHDNDERECYLRFCKSGCIISVLHELLCAVTTLICNDNYSLFRLSHKKGHAIPHLAPNTRGMAG